MAKQKSNETSPDGRILEFDQKITVTYDLNRFLKDGVDTVSCVGEVDLTGFSDRAKKVTVANIQLPLQDAIKFCEQFKDYCEKSEAPTNSSGLSDQGQRAEAKLENATEKAEKMQFRIKVDS